MVCPFLCNILSLSFLSLNVEVGSNIDDIKKLMQIENLWGAITGKALYSGALDIRAAIEIAQEGI